MLVVGRCHGSPRAQAAGRGRYPGAACAVPEEKHPPRPMATNP